MGSLASYDFKDAFRHSGMERIDGLANSLYEFEFFSGDSFAQFPIPLEFALYRYPNSIKTRHPISIALPLFFSSFFFFFPLFFLNPNPVPFGTLAFLRLGPTLIASSLRFEPSFETGKVFVWTPPATPPSFCKSVKERGKKNLDA